MGEPDIMDEIKSIQREGASVRGEERINRRLADMQKRVGVSPHQDELSELQGQVKAAERMKELGEREALAREAMNQKMAASQGFISAQRPVNRALDFIMDQDLGYADGGVVAAVVRWRSGGKKMGDLLEAKELLERLIRMEAEG